MISDTLFQAVHEIDSYLNSQTFDDIYIGKTRDEIVKLRNDMETTRRFLDTPPKNHRRQKETKPC